MSANIKIETSGPPTPDIVHRIRNFGEDVYLSLRDSCSVKIEARDFSHCIQIRASGAGTLLLDAV